MELWSVHGVDIFLYNRKLDAFHFKESFLPHREKDTSSLFQRGFFIK
jgi:hypothetical protein